MGNENTQAVQHHLKQALMDYHNQQLSIPTQMNCIKEEMSLTAKEQSLGSVTQMKGHSHHYFVSPYKNMQQNGGCSENLRLSHPEPLISSANVTKINYDIEDTSTSDTQQCLSKDNRLLSITKGRAKLAATEKLPPIFSIISPRRVKQTKSGDSKMWLGPPNSIPPNKRNEHIAAYKTIASHSLKSSDTASAQSSKSWTQLQQEQYSKLNTDYETSSDIVPRIILNTEYSNDDLSTISSADYTDNSDIMSQNSESTFVRSNNSRLYFRSTKSSNSSPHLRPVPDREYSLKGEYTESNFGNYSTNVALPSAEHSYIDEILSASSNIQRIKKTVHFAPDVRDITRETRAQPLSSTVKSSPVGIRLPLTYSGSTESVDQLPAVVEKYTIKNLPVLPNINPSSINVNANIIYIKDGQMQSRKTSSHSVNTHNASQPYHILRRRQTTPEAQEHGQSQKQEMKVMLPSTGTDTYNKPTSTTATLSTHNTSPSQPSSQKAPTQSKKQTTSQAPSKKASFTSKKVSTHKSKNNAVNTTGNSSKKSKKHRNGSETSSRNSTTSVSPILDPDDPEARYKAYSQAMLAVQARMREFDAKFGSPQKIAIPKEQDEKLFGKVVVPSANRDTKSNKGP